MISEDHYRKFPSDQWYIEGDVLLMKDKSCKQGSKGVRKGPVINWKGCLFKFWFNDLRAHSIVIYRRPTFIVHLSVNACVIRRVEKG